MTLRIPFAALKAISRFTSTDPSRMILSGVHFRVKDGKCVIVATDGRRCAAMQVDCETSKGDETAEALIDVSCVLKWRSINAGEQVLLRFGGDLEDEVLMRSGRCGGLGRLMLGMEYPKVAKVFEPFQVVENKPIAVNTRFLRSFGKARWDLTRQDENVTVFSQGPNLPLIVDIDVPNFTGIVMPLYRPCDASDTPDHIKPWL